MIFSPSPHTVIFRKELWCEGVVCCGLVFHLGVVGGGEHCVGRGTASRPKAAPPCFVCHTNTFLPHYLLLPATIPPHIELSTPTGSCFMKLRHLVKQGMAGRVLPLSDTPCQVLPPCWPARGEGASRAAVWAGAAE